MKKFDIDIDICGACNLRCPSCPQGNVKDYRLPHGFMAPELLGRIVDKAVRECPHVQINLFNWAEPLLHPRLPELIEIVQRAGIPCHLSSNLNLLPNADGIMAANPASLRISSSGFSQELYGRTHRGGDVDRLKRHMVELAAAKQRHQATTELSIYYHRYRHNLREESLMRDFSKGLGFNFHAVWALFFPLEKILAIDGEAVSDFSLTDEDQAVIASLALPLREALAAARHFRGRPCTLRDEALSLDFQGNATLCCGIFDARNFTLGNFLDMSLADIQKARQEHPLCRRCMAHGAHVYLTYGIDGMDEIALANLDRELVEKLGLRNRILWEKRQQRFYAIYQAYFARAVNDRQKARLKAQYQRLARLAGTGQAFDLRRKMNEVVRLQAYTADIILILKGSGYAYERAGKK